MTLGRFAAAEALPELIVLQRPPGVQPPSFRRERQHDLYETIRGLGVDLVPIFEPPLGAPDVEFRRAAPEPLFYRVIAPTDDLEEVKRQLHRTSDVMAAYVKPPLQPPTINNMQPASAPPAPATPDFRGRQDYLEPAPDGVASAAAWSLAGGRGGQVTIADVEGGWHLAHEALAGRLTDISSVGPHPDWIEHGTAVMATALATEQGLGVVGIAPDASGLVVSALSASGSSGAIRAAADRLQPGDVLMVELHRAGPRYGYQNRQDQLGLIAVEWWPDDLAVIQYAADRGICVVEAAGNGAENLSDAIYVARPVDFPPDWQDPFSAVDSGAIVVGAGAPPAGTHGRDHGPDRSRLGFSNYGTRLDVQGWGREVTTAGYGDLQGGSDSDRWYTDEFSGTSSATPVVAGAVACLQGIAMNRGRPLTPPEVRTMLRTTGSPQSGTASERIGSRPDLAALIGELDKLLPAP